MFIGFSWLRFLSRLAKAGLGIVTFGGTLSHLSPYTFKQVGNQVGNLRPIGGALWARPAPGIFGFKERRPHRLAATWGSQSWLQPAFSRLPQSTHKFRPSSVCPSKG